MNPNKEHERAANRRRLELQKRRARSRLLRQQGLCDAAKADARAVGKRAATPTPCSCAMCGNPRHSVLEKGSDRLTLQERKRDLRLKL